MPAKKVSLASARRFVDTLDVPRPTRTRGLTAQPVGTTITLEGGKDQAAIVGSDVVAFAGAIPGERREAIINSTMLAQLVANKQVADRTQIDQWYASYFEVLTNVGWLVRNTGFSEFHESSDNFDAHRAVVAVATSLLGPATTALALVTTTLTALQSMNESSPWIAIFHRESRTTRAARFQISLAQQDDNGDCFVDLMSFVLAASANLTQVLFFRAQSNAVTFRHQQGRVTINTTVLDGVREMVKAKVVSHASNFVSGLPDLS